MGKLNNKGSIEEMLYNIIEEMDGISADHIEDELWINPYLINEITSVVIAEYEERKAKERRGR